MAKIDMYAAATCSEGLRTLQLQAKQDDDASPELPPLKELNLGIDIGGMGFGMNTEAASSDSIPKQVSNSKGIIWYFE